MQDTLATTMTSRRDKQRARGRESQPLDLFVDGGILLDVGVGARNVSFWLVIIEVADEIFDRVTAGRIA